MLEAVPKIWSLLLGRVKLILELTIGSWVNYNYNSANDIIVNFLYLFLFLFSQGIPMASAKLIVACAFNEVRVVDISRSQLQSAAKTLKVPIKESESSSKEVLISNVAQALVSKGFVKIPPKEKISRDDVQILKPF